MTLPLVDVTDLSVHFPIGWNLPGTERRVLHAVDGVDFSIGRDEGFGLVGESGCGKSTIGKAILLLVKATSGRIAVDGRPVSRGDRASEKWLRRKVQAVFQSPYSSLSPRMRVRDIIAEPLILQRFGDRGAIRRRVDELLETVGLSKASGSLYPHEFSGGQRQRIAIARALGINPEVVVFDEPISALDVSIRAQMMNLVMALRREARFSYLFIAHDLSTVRYMCENVAVMYLGKFVEVGPAREVFIDPQHPYTKALVAAHLRPHPSQRWQPPPIAGEIPSPLNPPTGCRFHTRCPFVMDRCRTEEPALRQVGNRTVACHLYEPETPSVPQPAGGAGVGV
jgi:peptide/nickel transport system ATP-binding protein